MYPLTTGSATESNDQAGWGRSSASSGTTRGWAQALLSLLLIGLAVWASLSSVRPPDARPASAPQTEFSAERARIHQAALSERPHPAGSAEAQRVKSLIVAALQREGVEARVQEGVGSAEDPTNPAAGYVENVIATIPGTNPSGTIVLVAHYDAAPASLGAGDDGAGVSTLLETARALKQGERLQNDVMFVFTDAEEVGTLGAEAFLNQDQASAAGGVVLNIESRGSSGPAVMFETSPGNSNLISAYAKFAPAPVATSMSVELYRILPNYTDLTPMIDSGRFTGMNFSYLDGSAIYHSPEDTFDRQSAESLQHHGNNTLGLVRGLGDTQLETITTPAKDDATYFPFLGKLVIYPQQVVGPLAFVAAFAVLLAAVLMSVRKAAQVRELLLGTLIAAIPLGLSLVAGSSLWSALTAFQPAYGQLEEAWQPGWYRVGLIAGVAATTVTCLVASRRWVSARSIWFGGLTWSAAVGIITAFVVPGASYAFAIPALLGALALLATLFWRCGRWVPLFAGALATVILAPTVALLFPAAGVSGSSPALFFAALLTLLLIPAFEPLLSMKSPRSSKLRGRRAGAAVLAWAIAITALVIGLTIDRFDASAPIPVALAHLEDVDAERAYWLSSGEDPTGWSDAMVNGPIDLSATYPVLDGEVRAGQAPLSNPTAPEVVVTDSRLVGENRMLDIKFSSQIGARSLYIEATEGEIEALSLNGRAIPSHGESTFRIESLREGSARFTITFKGDPPPSLRLIEGADGVDERPGFVPRPAGVIAAEGPTSEMRFVSRTVTLR